MRTALQDLEHASDAARSSTGNVVGLVRVTSSIAFGQVVFLPLLRALHERHPQLQVDLLLTDKVLDLVAARAARGLARRT